jgi:hypothetical protein
MLLLVLLQALALERGTSAPAGRSLLRAGAGGRLSRK